MKSPISEKPVLVTGATGYVGGRLVPLLLSRGFRVRAVSRSVEKLKARPWSRHPHVELMEVDVMDIQSLEDAVEGCHSAYWLVHSMEPGVRDFPETEKRAAQNMALAARVHDLERIVFLSGLGVEGDPKLSRHLKSRHEVSRILAQGEVPVTTLRAAMIIGAGSASFEILRYLVDRLPVMLTPSWIRTLNQPVAITNVLEYLAACILLPEARGETFDIGGPDILTYQDLMDIYAEEAGVSKRWIIPIPFQSPRISAFWVQLICPVPKSLASPLVEGLRNSVVCEDTRIRELVPQKLLDCRSAISEAIRKVAQEQVETRWSDAGRLLPPEWLDCGDAHYAGGTVLDCCYRIRLSAPKEAVWDQIRRIGGDTGWFYGNRLWKIRGGLDRMMGGVGLRRGRRDPVKLQVGDALDFWRVLDVKDEKRLLLLAEMKLPGEALLEFRIDELEPGITEIRQMSRFLPRGVWGVLYWYMLVPFHDRIFKGMLAAIARSTTSEILDGPHPFEYLWKRDVCELPDPPPEERIPLETDTGDRP